MAYFLHSAFPKIIKPAINALTEAAINICIELIVVEETNNFPAIVDPAAPERMLQTSPITSLQMLETFSAFFIIYIDT